MGIIAAMKAPILSCAIVLMLSLGAVSAVYANSATWSLNPTSSDWNTAANWTPPTVPNAPQDVASFSLSNQTNVSISAVIRVDSIVFDPDASAYAFTLGQPNILHVQGHAGIMNNSRRVQSFVNTASCDSAFPGGIYFHGNASAGSQTQFINEGGPR
jgi:hypothetical protein